MKEGLQMSRVFTYTTKLHSHDTPMITFELESQLKTTFTNDRLLDPFLQSIKNCSLDAVIFEEAEYLVTANKTIDDVLKEDGYKQLKKRNIHKKDEPSVFTYTFNEQPRITEDFAQSLSSFFKNGYDEQTKTAFANLKQKTQNVKPYLKITDQQLKNLKELNDLLYDINYHKDWKLVQWHISRTNRFEQLISEQELLQFYPEQIVKEILAESKDFKSRNMATIEDAIIEFYAYMINAYSRRDSLIHGFWINLYESSKAYLREIQSMLYEENCEDSCFLIDFKELKKINVHSASAENDLIEHLRKDPSFNCQINIFRDRNGSPFMSSDFVLKMIRYFNGGHTPQLEIMLKSIYDAQIGYEKSKPFRDAMIYADPVKFIYYPSNIYLNSSFNFRMDLDFVETLTAFFKGGNTKLTQGHLKDLRNCVEVTEQPQ